MKRYVICHQCDKRHEAEYSHQSQYGGHAIYVVVCTEDWLTDYYNDDAIVCDACEMPGTVPVFDLKMFCAKHARKLGVVVNADN